MSKRTPARVGAGVEASRRRRTKLLVAAVVSAIAVSMLAVAPAGAAPRAATATKCADPSGTVKVGITYFGNVAAAYSSIGGDSELAPGDRAIIDGYKAGIASLNASGGLAGCQVEPVIVNFPAATSDFNQESQKVCSTFTQDNKVVAVYQGAYETKVAAECYAKAKVPFFAVGGKYQPSCDDMKKYEGFIYFVPGVGACRFGSFISMWNKAGLFPKDAKVGILVSDDGTGEGQRVADKSFGPALKKLKIPYETFSYHQSMNVPDFANTNSSMAAAILKFKADGVNVVLMTPAGPAGVAAFMPQAVNQAYFPAYGLTTADGLGVAGALGGNAIKQGSAISWSTLDLPLPTQQSLPANSAVTECATWSAPSTVTLSGSSPYCDFINVLQAGFAKAKKLDAASLAKGIDALGDSFVSSMHYNGATQLGAKAYGGASVAQTLTFDPNTKTWLLKTGQKAVTIP